MQWQKAVLHNLCEVTSSKRIYASEYQTEGIPFYRGKEISEKYYGNLDVSTELFITESKFNEIKEKFGVPQAGDLLLTSVGTLGNPYVVKEGEIFYFKDGNLTWFKNFKGLDSNYLFYWLVSPQGKAELKKCTIGSSQSAFTIVLLKDMQIAVPPLPTQRRIADILSAYDDLIENNTRRIRILEQVAQAIYQEWFGMVDKESLPKGWKIVTIADLYDTSSGGTPSRKHDEYYGGEINWVKTQELRDCFVFKTDEQITEEGLNNSSAKVFPKGTVLIALYGATIGKLGILALPASTNQACCALLPKTEVYGRGYAYFYFLANRQKIIGLGGGAAQQNISQVIVKKLEIMKPSSDIMNKFNNFVEPLLDMICSLQAKNDNLRQTRDLLLPRLVSGEVEVV